MKQPSKVRLQRIHHEINLRSLGSSQEHARAGIDFFNDDGNILYRYQGGHCPPVSHFIDKYKQRENAKKYLEDTGVTVSVLCRMIKSVVMKEVIEPHPLWDKLYYRRRAWTKSWEEYTELEHYELMAQCEKDGIKNILPLVAKSGLSPMELKKVLGKTLWKSICKNSYTRNKQLSKYWLDGKQIDILKYRQSLRSGCMDTGPHGMGQRMIDEIRAFSGVKSDKEMNSNEVFLANMRFWSDTKFELREDFNPNWSLRRVREEHGKIIRIRNEEDDRRRAERDEKYAKLLEVNIGDLHKGLQEIIFESGVVAKPLLSLQEIKQEGRMMHHCVGTYAESSAQGNYLVWHLTKDKQEATLGITVGQDFLFSNIEKAMVEKGNSYHFQQMYGFQNKILEDPAFRRAADEIVKMLNDLNRKEIK